MFQHAIQVFRDINHSSESRESTILFARPRPLESTEIFRDAKDTSALRRLAAVPSKATRDSGRFRILRPVREISKSLAFDLEIFFRVTPRNYTATLGLAKFATPIGYDIKEERVDCFCFREVCVDEGQQLSLAHGCQFYEVSAAESPAGAALAFQALLREARSVQLLRALPIRRKLGVHSVSRVLGTIFGKNTTKDRKKRPSLSI